MRSRVSLLLALACWIPACSHGGDTPPATLPLAPDLLGVAVQGSGSALVTWTDLSSNEADFVIQTSPDNINWTDADSFPANSTSGVVTGLVPGQLVHVRVGSRNVKGTSPSPTSISVTPPVPAWTSPSITGPAFLYWTCSAYDPARGRMIVYGGRDDSLASSDALYAYDLDSPGWTLISPALGNTPPAARFGASLIYDPLGDRLILFGGRVGMAASAELWEFRLGTSEWFPLGATGSAPSARQHHTAVYDPDLERMVVYGGQDGGSFPTDVRALTLPSGGTPAWTAFPIAGTEPAGRSRHSAVFDSFSRRMVVFGGITPLNDQEVWTLDLRVSAPTAWEHPSVLGGPPSFRQGHVAVWDSLNRQMLLYGGADDTDFPNSEVWTLALGETPTWRLITTTGTAGDRFFGTAVFDPVAAQTVVFGGVIDDFFTAVDDTWLLDLGP